ncbi:hypothetical protein BC835DRAFT_1520746 [Cytidiella melzeri]|nr:hypothetical protein BC835DRAFT_1520746 [Cytidiella melzeri]
MSWSQVVLANGFVEGDGSQLQSAQTSMWQDQRLFPAYVAGASLIVLSLHMLYGLKPGKFNSTIRNDEPQSTVSRQGTSWLANRGGPIIFAFKTVRLIAVVTLCILATATAAHVKWSWYHIAIVSTLGYAVVLGVLNVLSPNQTSRIFSFHLSITTLAMSALYAYRDVWPLMTLTRTPADEAEGQILWAKIALITFVSVILPLFEPYPYIPVNPSEPSPVVNPEQTASLFSFLLYTFLDPLILKASRVQHLGHDQLPPLADYDLAENLIKRSYRHLDTFSGAKRRHLFWGLVIIFRRSLFYQVVILVSQAIFKIAGPIGINKLLANLEDGGQDALVKPWVWILVLALSPMCETILFQLYIYLSSATLVYTEAIITSLVFDHALRIRLKAETDEKKETGTTTLAIQKVLRPPATSTTAATVVAPSTPSNTAGGSEDATKESEKDTTKVKSNLMGKINNLVTSDLSNIVNGRHFLFIVLSAPLQLAFGMWFLYAVLGWSSLVGLGVMVALMPVPAWVASLTSGVQKKKMKATDARVQIVTEMMSALRMIKLFGWEPRVKQAVAEKREEELSWIWKRKVIGFASSIANHIMPLAHMVVTYAVYTLVHRKPLTASIVFSSMTAFNMIQAQVYQVSGFLPMQIQANVSLGRVAEFLRDTELLDRFASQSTDKIVVDSSAHHKTDIGIGRATFSWSNEDTDGSFTPSKQTFRLHIDDELVFKKGCLNLIIGPTGSGKTSMLMALLGEMHYMPDGPESWMNVPREGGVAYAAQESWVQNESIKENIIFGSPVNEERYKKVIHQCGLTRDLSLFEAGDATEVGEKGLTLSGGQKARVTLARAVYSRAEIVLLDDVLAALDVHTSRWIVDKCFKGDLLRDRTVLLVTHNVAMAGPLASFVVCLDADGHIISQGSVSDAIAKDSKLIEEIEHEEKAVETVVEAEGYAVDKKPVEGDKGKLVVVEEIAHGHISWPAFKLFFTGLGGNYPIAFWLGWACSSVLTEIFDTLEVWWLGYWASQYLVADPTKVSVAYYLGMYSLIVILVVVFNLCGLIVYTFGSLRASRVIHGKLVGALLGSTFRWLDITPTSRVIARCTQDIQAIDGAVADIFNSLCIIGLVVVVKLGAVILYTPAFILPAIIIATAGAWLGTIYLKAQLSVKREMSNARAPVLGIIASAISGLPSIRAYAAQDAFKKETMNRVNSYTRAARVFFNLNRWISVRIDALTAIFPGCLAFYLVYGGAGYTPSSIGFVLAMANGFSQMILLWVRIYNDFEVNGNSLERVEQYLGVEQEPAPRDGGVPPAWWPSSGTLEVEKLTARYSLDGPKVLQDVSFRIAAGQRVGIVGRTGSGKSTLTLALLRCIFTEGKVVYDGISTDTINLDALRSNITIIPQVPELLSGPLRHNLDVFGQYDDATLNDALRAAGLFSLQRLSVSNEENRVTLNSEIASGGGNLSIGQRQIIALARAIVRQSKLLVLDEATSAIDYETDAVIQESLRSELRKDVTVVTVAHRLQTIMDYDKVMVLDTSRLVEFDSPRELLKRESLLRALVDESADREALYAMAEGRTGVVGA